MPSLRELQADFARALDGDEGALLRHVRPGGLDPRRRVFIYRNNLHAGLGGVLRAVYPAIERLVGEGFFRFAAREYVRRCPSRDGDLERYGEDFASLLEALPQLAPHPYLPDVARLEWAVHTAYFAAEAEPLGRAGLAALAAAAEPRLCLHPAVRVLRSPWPVLRIWTVNQPHCREDPAVDLDLGGESVLVHRPGAAVRCEPLAEDECRLLQALARDPRLARAAAAADLGAAPARLGRILHRLATGGVFAAPSPSPTPGHSGEDP